MNASPRHGPEEGLVYRKCNAGKISKTSASLPMLWYKVFADRAQLKVRLRGGNAKCDASDDAGKTSEVEMEERSGNF